MQFYEEKLYVMLLKNILSFLCSVVTISGICQSFEAVNIPDLTTTPSASRSVNFVDVNGDGWDDIFITNGPFAGQNNMLYLNNQNNTFTTIAADPIVNDNDRSDGASFADVDNDGDLDAFVVTFGANGVGKKNYFYRNQGNGSFVYEPNSAMGIPLTYSEMCAWIDLNNDQNLDLYVTNSVGNLHNLYYENQGDGSFEGVFGLTISGESLPSRSIDWIDYDGDGDSDLFVTNEENHANSLFRNDGPNNFTQINDLTITLSFNNSVGSSWADIDNDGDFDLFVANYATNGEANQLYFNENGIFSEVTNSPVTTAITSSFGSTFGDVDNDGDLDLFVCNAYLGSQDTNFLYLNDGSGNFSLDTGSALALHQGYTFGAAFGDYDNDGWLDIVLGNTLNENQSNALFHNTGTGNNWVKLHCQGTESNFSAVGAVVKLKAIINGTEVWQTRSIASASGYCSQNSYTVHFGLGDATTIEELIVKWPAGTTESFSNITINEAHLIIEGQGTLGQPNFNLGHGVVYPNPFTEQISIAFLGSKNESLLFQVYTMAGKLIFEETVTDSENHTSPPLSFLTKGTYVYTLSNVEGKIVKTGKIIKQ